MGGAQRNYTNKIYLKVGSRGSAYQCMRAYESWGFYVFVAAVMICENLEIM